MKKVLILGGGIAGVESAIAFCKKGFMVELVSDRDFLFIYPISIWIPVGTARFEDVAFPLSKISSRHGFKLTIDRVTAIDGADRSVTLEHGGHRRDADIVVIALGSGKTQLEGIEHTLSICGSPEQSLQLKEKIDALIERGHGKIAFGFGGNPKDRAECAADRGSSSFSILTTSSGNSASVKVLK